MSCENILERSESSQSWISLLQWHKLIENGNITSCCDALLFALFSNELPHNATSSIMTTTTTTTTNAKSASRNVRFDPTVEIREIPPIDPATKRAIYYSRRDIERFIAHHYMEEMIGILAFAYEVPQRDPLLSLHLGFDQPPKSNNSGCRRRVKDSNSQGARMVL